MLRTLVGRSMGTRVGNGYEYPVTARTGAGLKVNVMTKGELQSLADPGRKTGALKGGITFYTGG